MKVSPRTGALMPERGFYRVTSPRLSPDLTGWESHDHLLVISSCSDMQLPGRPEGVIGPTWLVSVSRLDVATMTRCRPTDDDMHRVVDAFDMPAFEEDNHLPGISRGLFCPHDPDARVECECKITETVHVEADGYTWTNPTDGPCRGCVLARMRLELGASPMPCPIHGDRAHDQLSATGATP